MTQLNALELTSSLRRRMVDFAVDNNFVRDLNLGDIARKIWSGPPEQGGLISDIWVEGAFPSKAAPTSLDDLVRAGQFHSRLSDVLDSTLAMPKDRKLYTHQFESIEKASSGTPGNRPAIVVTAGTGAGKTEAFLLPILNDLYQNPPQESQGAKCIILYPMNALVNDQVDRLYTWLKEQSQVTLFHFTSETPENKKLADSQGIPPWEPCRMRTRQQARGLESHTGERIEEAQRGPTPDIVITNYSMLEYMLCRPQDSVFFGPSLRAVVLDEAHLYTGTLAAEITLLLRRLLLRCGLRSEDVLHYATSATLGSGDHEELRNFASDVFSKPAEMVHVIAGEQSKAPMGAPSPPEDTPTAEDIAVGEWLDGPAIVEDNAGEQELAVDKAACGKLMSRLTTFVSSRYLQKLDPEENRPAALLHNSLSAAPLIHQLEDILWANQHISMTELGERIFGEWTEHSARAIVLLLQLAASARLEPTSYPLVPHRIHVLARPVDGLIICLNTACSGSDTLLPPLGAVAAGYQDTCGYCGSRTLSLERCRNCGEWLLAGMDTGEALAPALPGAREGEDDSQRSRQLLLTVDPSASTNAAVYIDPTTGERRGTGAAGAVRMVQHSECPNCQAEESQITSFYSGAPLSLSILAETLLAEMPEFPAGKGNNNWLPALGRRLLTFSDSRREAARLGPLLTNQHEQQLVRAAIVNVLEETPLADEEVLQWVRDEIERTLQRLNESNLSAGMRHQLEQLLEQRQVQLTQLTAGGSVEDWAAALSKRDSLSQILDRPHATGDSAVTWSQLRWEDNQRNVSKRTHELLGRELASPIRRSVNTLESLGLVEVTYPGLEQLTPSAYFLGTLPTETLRECVSRHWTDMLASLCDTLRTDGAVTLGDELDDTYNFGRLLIGRWAAADDDRGARLIRFIGATNRQRRRRFAAAALKRCGMSDSQAEVASAELLRSCFEQLLEASRSNRLPWLKTDQRQAQGGKPVDAIRLDFFGLGLRRPATLFRCRTTGHVWPRSVAGCAPDTGCEGTLEAVEPGELDNDARLGRRRREYRNSPIFKMGLWAEEHSAQLDPKENRRLQDLFKAGIRNILSSTTTLELGIDIGGLNGVLMSNVPPGKASYLQRAGRAGRRADGSSVVTTFSRPRPFDREVFHRVGDYLSTPLRRPVVFLGRKRVARRHLHALLLGEFFSRVYRPQVGAMDAYGRMGGFCGMKRTLWWESGSPKPPLQTPETSGDPPLSEQFTDFLQAEGEKVIAEQPFDLLGGTPLASGSIMWKEMIRETIESFVEAVKDWQSEYDALLDQWNTVRQGQQNARGQANAIHYQLRLRYDTTVIEALADRQFLPRYGFPINVLKLRVTSPDEDRPNRIREEDQFRLERNSLLALREYVPGSQLLAGGRLIRSRGILKHWTGENINTAIGLRGLYAKCRNNHLYYWASGEATKHCPFCGEPAKQSPTPYIVPQYGFSSAAWDPPRWSTDPELVGSVETVSATFTPASLEGSGYIHRDDLGGVSGLTASYREDGELLIYNRGDKRRGFAICLRCGYSDSEIKPGQGRVGLPEDFEDHARLNSPNETRRCWNVKSAPVLRNQTLAAREVTDVLLLDFSKCLGARRTDFPLVTTLGYGLHRAAAQMLQLDGRELGVVIVPAGESGRGLGALLYDNVPGGAGHVRELLEDGSDWLDRTRKVLFVDAAHDQRCKSACLDCLLSFETQDAMRQGNLNRPLALATIAALLDGEEIVAQSTSPVGGDGNTQSDDYEATSKPSQEERLERARARRARNRS